VHIVLIAPSWRSVSGPTTKSLFPPLSLAVVAALTPSEHTVRIIDESVEDIDPDLEADLVGITCLTAVAPRAYEIADSFRSRGVPVVLGGMHPSALPEEAAKHADCVVVGEAEGVWEQVLEDIQAGRARKIYRSKERPSLAGLPIPRRDLFDPRKYYTTSTIQTSRGCPYSCSFCSVTRFFGRTYRTRPIADILREIETLKDRIVLFVDDNIVGNPAHARELFRALIPYRLRWIGQSSINIAWDQELLALAAKSGCMGLFIGFESLAAENLKKVGKGLLNRVDSFLKAIKRIHSHGIGIEGAFIFGFDQDDEGVFARTVEFAKKARLAAAQFGILTPFPGTPLFADLESQGRIVDRSWSRYTISNAVFEPLKMSREKLEQGFRWAYREFYSYRSIVRRLIPFKRHLPFFLTLNISFRRIALQPRYSEK